MIDEKIFLVQSDMRNVQAINAGICFSDATRRALREVLAEAVGLAKACGKTGQDLLNISFGPNDNIAGWLKNLIYGVVRNDGLQTYHLKIYQSFLNVGQVSSAASLSTLLSEG